MNAYAQHLQWIDSQQERMTQLVRQWASINSGSTNLVGLARMSHVFQEAMAPLGASVREVELPPQEIIDSTGKTTARPLGRALLFRKRPAARPRVLLVIHMDTVYPPDHPFQETSLTGPDQLRGPGVADAKGGLVVLLVALEALERRLGTRTPEPATSSSTPQSAIRNPQSPLGWDVVINPDEELGSPSSSPLLLECAREADLGLVFEPAMADGTMVSQRRGLGNFVLVVRGRRAHAGRDPHLGRNAISALAQLVVSAERIAGGIAGLTMNVGHIEGGGPVNVVPDLAIARINLRFDTVDAFCTLEAQLKREVDGVNGREGFSAELHGGMGAPPKLVDPATGFWLEQLSLCAGELGMPARYTSTGGVSDANRLVAAGLPVLDSLGPASGNLHSDGEYVAPSTLPRKAKLAALLLMKLAAGEIAWPARREPCS